MRHSCKQALCSLVWHQAGGDNADMKLPSIRFAFLLAASAALGACAVVPAYDAGYDPVPPVTVYAAPPAPIVEYRGLAPYPGYIWIDGFWNWGGVRYVWTPGRWVNPPAGQVWVPRIWQRDGDRWHSHGGHWGPRRDELHPVPQPAWPRREFQSPPMPRPVEPRRWPEPPREPNHPPRDGGPPFPAQGAVVHPPMPAPSSRADGPPVRPGELRTSPPAMERQEPPSRPGSASPQGRRGPDENRRFNRKWPPEDGDQRDRR